MKQLKLALLISAIATTAFACASTNTNAPATNNTNSTGTANAPVTAPVSPSAPDELAAARSTYSAACIKCHRENGEGGAVELGEGETLNVPSFKSGHGLGHTDIQFARQIAKGGDGMPAFEKKLSPEQINGLVRFIRREFQAGLIKQGTANPTH
jgi:cytochrome c551